MRNRYNQAPHLTQDTNLKVTTTQLDIADESQEVSSFPAGEHKASINRRARKHSIKRHKSSVLFVGLMRNAASDQGLHCLLTGCFIKLKIKIKQYHLKPLLTRKWTGPIDNCGESRVRCGT